MKRCFSWLLVLTAALVIGCADGAKPTETASNEEAENMNAEGSDTAAESEVEGVPAEEAAAIDENADGSGTDSEAVVEGSESAPVEETAANAEAEGDGEAPAEAHTMALTPENTKIEFIGHHTDRTKDSHDCSFEKFSGEAEWGDTLKSVSVTIDVASIKTPNEKLTAHLKNADFFDVNQYPEAMFKSTAVKGNGDGTVEITGDLTMLDKTESLTFPAKVSTEGGLTLKAEFNLDRTRWGMDYGLENVEKEVPMTITIGG